MRRVVLAILTLAVMGIGLPAVATDTPGAVDPTKGHWTLKAENGNSTTIGYGTPNDRPFMGDWDCDGVDSPGLYRQSDGFVYLRNSNTTGFADITFFFGVPGDVPIIGDFDGDGCDTVSVYRPAQARFFIINDLGANGGNLGFAEYSFLYGRPGDTPFFGDWDGDGVDTPGLRRPSDGFVYLRNTNSTGFADIAYFYGIPGDLPFAGDWDDDGVDTVGLYRPSDRTFYLRNLHSTGVAHTSFAMGEPGSLPVAGDFDLSLPPPPPPLQLQTVISGLDLPVFVAAPPGDHRLFVVEQTGDIEIVENGVRRPTPFLDLTVTSGGERGLLGLAFHPDYPVNGKFYVNYTIGSVSRISEFTVSGDPDLANAGSERVLLQVTQPFTNHNGGMLAFDAQGYLLIAFGDGGGAGDPGNRSQDPNNLLGKILRIDVDNTSSGKQYAIPAGNPFENGGGAPEVYVRGVRNPWRFVYDLGNLYVADVGQDVREEVTVVRSGSLAGANLGWRVWEGTRCYAGPCTVSGFVFPQIEYSHPNGCSVTGGFVYRGSAITGLAGTYFYGDFCGGWIRSFRYENSVVGPQTLRTDLGTVPLLSSFGIDGDGEMYVTSLQGGVVRKIVPAGS
jgi:glucose/arabinose dehydrogenase